MTTETAASFTCPRCEGTTRLPSDVAAGYCPGCRWWTGDSLLGSDDVMRQAQIDGPEHLSDVDYEERGRRIIARHLAAQHRMRALLLGFTTSMREADAAFRRVGEAMRSSTTTISDWWAATRPPTSRVVTKRLRHGRARERKVPIRQAQPRPWKVAR